MSPISSVGECDAALYKLLAATLRKESLTAKRDSEIAPIQKRYAPRIEKEWTEIATLESEIETFYREHHDELEQDGKKSVQLANGLLGMRSPTNPALVPLHGDPDDQKVWTKIAAKVKELWQRKYFHKPKPPALDKVKLKKELDEQQLKECGLKLDDSETFYYELNRLVTPQEPALELEAAA